MSHDSVIKTQSFPSKTSPTTFYFTVAAISCIKTSSKHLGIKEGTNKNRISKLLENFFICYLFLQHIFFWLSFFLVGLTLAEYLCIEKKVYFFRYLFVYLSHIQLSP